MREDAPQVAFDLPTQARGLRQRADSYGATSLSGVVTYSDGTATGALPNRLARGAQAAPAG